MTVHKQKIAIALLILALQGCSDPEEKMQTFIDNGKSLYDQKAYKKASLEFKNALQIDAKYAEAYYYLGLIKEQEQNGKQMFANYSRAVNFNPKHVLARLKLGKMFLAGKKIDESLLQVKAILDLDATNIDALSLKGSILFNQGNNSDAEVLVKQILQQSPLHLETIKLKIQILVQDNASSQALELLENSLKTHADVVDLYLLRLSIHARDKNLVAIEKDYIDLIQRFPEQLNFAYSLAKIYSQTKRFDKAQAILEKTIVANPDNVTVKLQLLDFMESQKSTKLEELIKTYLQIHPKAVRLHFRLSRIYFRQNKLPEAKETLISIVDNLDNAQAALDAKIALAKLAMKENDIAKMQQLVKEVLEVDSQHLEGSILQAEVDIKAGFYEQVISNLHSILRNYPKSDTALVLLAQTYSLNKSPELALENFHKAININPSNFFAVMPVVNQMLAGNDLKRAESILLQALSGFPNHAGGLKLLAKVKLLQRDWVATQKIVDKVASLPGGKSYAGYLQGMVLQGQNKYAAAIEAYKQVLIDLPSLSEALNALISCYEALNQRNISLLYLAEFSEKHPNNAYLIILRSKLLIASQRSDEAAAVLKSAIANNPKMFKFYELLAQLYDQQQQPEQTIQILKDGILALPNSISLRLGLGGFYEKNNLHKEAVEQYEYVVKQQPELKLAANNLVAILMEHFPSEANLKLALNLVKTFEESENPYFLDTYAWVLLQNNQTREVLQIFKNIVAQEPKIATFRYHLAVAHQKLNNPEAAIKVLKKSLLLGDFAEKSLAEKLLDELKQSLLEAEAT